MPAAKKQTTKAKKTAKKPKSKPKAKAVAKSAKDTMNLAQISKIENKKIKKSNGYGVAALIIGVIALAGILALLLGNQNVRFDDLTDYTGKDYNIRYPESWSFEESSDEIEFFDGDTSEESTSGFVIVDSGEIVGYSELDDTQKKELVNLALKNLQESDESITEDFDNLDDSKITISSHPSAEYAINFRFDGDLKKGGEGRLEGFMIITDSGQSYVIFAGSNSDVYEVNADVFDQMLDSFEANQ